MTGSRTMVAVRQTASERHQHPQASYREYAPQFILSRETLWILLDFIAVSSESNKLHVSSFFHSTKQP